MSDTGKILSNQGFKSLSEFLLKSALIPDPNHGNRPSAAKFVEKLVETFPAFADKADYAGKEIFILKKAQLLAGDLYRNFKNRDPRFDFYDIDQLTVFSDNVLPAMLRKVTSPIIIFLTIISARYTRFKPITSRAS